MSTSPSDRYHHGSLRAALLHAADEILDEGGSGAVSLREAARRAGVSATASYRHFADKEAMLAALAARAFAEFGVALERAARDSDDPLSAMGVAYVRFALDRPGRFRLMFGPAIADRGRYQELQAAARSAFAQLGGAVRQGSQSALNSHEAAIAAWALVHGLSQLFIDGMLPGQDPEALTRSITQRRQQGRAERG